MRALAVKTGENEVAVIPNTDYVGFMNHLIGTMQDGQSVVIQCIEVDEAQYDQAKEEKESELDKVQETVANQDSLARKLDTRSFDEKVGAMGEKTYNFGAGL